MNNNSIYTAEELEELALIKRTRMNIITDMTASGTPDRSGDIRVLNEVMSATDKMIVDSANTRLKQRDTANNEATTAMVVNLLKESRANKQKFIGDATPPTIAKEHAKVDLVPGETEINPERLAPDDFVVPVFDPNEIQD